MKRLSLAFVLPLIVVAFILEACSSVILPSVTPAAAVSIIGVLTPWTKDTPVAHRHVALCRSLGDPRDGLCELLPRAAVTDRQGRFQFYDIPEGIYFLLYDSGFGDFDEAMAQWAGKTLHFGDREWLAEFLGVDPSQDDFDYRMPVDLGLSPNVNWLSSYCLLTLLVGESPFIIAHDLQSVSHDQELHCAVITVVPGQIAKADFQALYFGT